MAISERITIRLTQIYRALHARFRVATVRNDKRPHVVYYTAGAALRRNPIFVDKLNSEISQSESDSWSLVDTPDKQRLARVSHQECSSDCKVIISQSNLTMQNIATEFTVPRKICSNLEALVSETASASAPSMTTDLNSSSSCTEFPSRATSPSLYSCASFSGSHSQIPKAPHAYPQYHREHDILQVRQLGSRSAAGDLDAAAWAPLAPPPRLGRARPAGLPRFVPDTEGELCP
ncbi:hypothetical protein H0H81_001637 [Sphagnurus paluster]|uniref:Uncharacterized protein n=1 Tax=Sphagnurus paluster TaxID=117069 RepID=A0A9P7KHL1_9AGAR|nr:hypothetical protein H0H81_001637 [Sphagnurus paluster]